MGDVRYFKDEVILNDRGENEALVGFLEEMLKKAKDGEIVGMAGGVQYVDGAGGDFTAGFVRNQMMIGTLFCAITGLTG